MADQKSKLPDLNEITSMAGKLFTDVKKSIVEIIDDYKTNHPKCDDGACESKTATVKKTATVVKTKTETKSTKDTDDTK